MENPNIIWNLWTVYRNTKREIPTRKPWELVPGETLDATWIYPEPVQSFPNHEDALKFLETLETSVWRNTCCHSWRGPCWDMEEFYIQMEHKEKINGEWETLWSDCQEFTKLSETDKVDLMRACGEIEDD